MGEPLTYRFSWTGYISPLLDIVASNETYRQTFFPSGPACPTKWIVGRDLCIEFLAQKAPSYMSKLKDTGVVQRGPGSEWVPTEKWTSSVRNPVTAKLHDMKREYNKAVKDHHIDPSWTKFSDVPAERRAAFSTAYPYHFRVRALMNPPSSRLVSPEVPRTAAMPPRAKPAPRGIAPPQANVLPPSPPSSPEVIAIDPPASLRVPAKRERSPSTSSESSTSSVDPVKASPKPPSDSRSPSRPRSKPSLSSRTIPAPAKWETSSDTSSDSSTCSDCGSDCSCSEGSESSGFVSDSALSPRPPTLRLPHRANPIASYVPGWVLETDPVFIAAQRVRDGTHLEYMRKSEQNEYNRTSDEKRSAQLAIFGLRLLVRAFEGLQATGPLPPFISHFRVMVANAKYSELFPLMRLIRGAGGQTAGTEEEFWQDESSSSRRRRLVRIILNDPMEGHVKKLSRCPTSKLTASYRPPLSFVKSMANDYFQWQTSVENKARRIWNGSHCPEAHVKLLYFCLSTSQPKQRQQKPKNERQEKQVHGASETHRQSSRTQPSKG